ncbi:MAG: DNA-directed RNA polymerase subunit delta [Bacilli bacterium]
MKGKSLLDLAYDVILETGQENLPISFHDLWEEVTKRANFEIEQIRGKIGRFYTDLSLDGRFVTLIDNFWDLRIHHTFDKVHINMNEVYSEVEESDEIDEEELEYLKPERAEKFSDGDEDSEDDDEEKED